MSSFWQWLHALLHVSLVSRLLWNALNLSDLSTCRIDLEITKRKPEACTDPFSSMITPRWGESVRLMWWEREPSITRSISAVQPNQGEIGSVSSVALHHQIFLRQSACVSVFWLEHGEIALDIWRNRTNRKYRKVHGNHRTVRTTNLPGNQTPWAHISESFHPEYQRECPGCPVETVVGRRTKGKFVSSPLEL